MANIRTITYRAGYKITQDFQGMEGVIEVVADVGEDETPDEAFAAARAEVRGWLKADHAQATKTLDYMIENLPPSRRG
jgi:hypothetical protein